jgi:hypothetical protein
MLATLAFASAALAGEKTYEVTGRVVEGNEKIDGWSVAQRPIVVQKGSERLVIDRAYATCNIEPKVGDTVTVHYRRHPTRFGDDLLEATRIEVKAAGRSKQ